MAAPILSRRAMKVTQTSVKENLWNLSPHGWHGNAASVRLVCRPTSPKTSCPGTTTVSNSPAIVDLGCCWSECSLLFKILRSLDLLDLSYGHGSFCSAPLACVLCFHIGTQLKGHHALLKATAHASSSGCPSPSSSCTAPTAASPQAGTCSYKSGGMKV